MSDSGSYSDGGPVDPTKEGAKKEIDPAINLEEHNSFSDLMIINRRKVLMKVKKIKKEMKLDKNLLYNLKRN